MNQQHTVKISILLVLLLFQMSIFAQVENDRCENAVPITLGIDSLSCVLVVGDTRGTEDALRFSPQS